MDFAGGLLVQHSKLGERLKRRLQLKDGYVGRFDPTKISALITWCRSPSPEIETIERILNDLSIDDLKHLLLYERGPAGRIAWLEFGRRVGFVDFHVGLSVTDREVALTYEGEGPGIHGLALFVESDDADAGE